jgi:hypothetical protein
MTIKNKCNGLHLYNYMKFRTDLKMEVEYRQVKDIPNINFFIKNKDDIANLETFAKDVSHLKDKYRDSWVTLLDKKLWLCLMKLEIKGKNYTFYSCEIRKRDALEQIMLKYNDNIKTILD